MCTEGRTDGPAFCDKEGKAADSTKYEELFHIVLARTQDERPDLMSLDIDV